MLDTNSEAHRAACEARYVARLGDRASDYLELVRQKRGKAAADSLRDAARAEYRKMVK